MRAKEAVPVLALIWGVSMETAWVLDRSLADAGFRQKVKGRNPPHMTLREGVHFLLACMTYRTATKAADDVAHWASFRWKPVDPECVEHGSREEVERNIALASLSHMPEVEELEFGDDTFTRYPTDYKEAIVDKLMPFVAEDGSVGFVDYLVALARWLVSIDGPYGGDVKIEIVPSHDAVRVSYRMGNDREHSDDFFPPEVHGARGAPPDETVIYRSCYIYGDALAEIPARTEGLGGGT
jgi:hypothetical protein